MPTRTSWAWIAGIIDGEGCIYMHRNRDGYCYPILEITNTNEALLGRFQAQCGVGHTYPNVARPNVLSLRYGGRKAVEILQKALPYLTKNREAELVLEYWRHRKGMSSEKKNEYRERLNAFHSNKGVRK